MSGARPRLRRLLIGYWALAVAFLAAQGAAALYFTTHPDFAESGPGDLRHATVNEDQLPAAIRTDPGSGHQLRAAYVADAPGGPLWVVYRVRTSSGEVRSAYARDARTSLPLRDPTRLKGIGAWLYIGAVKSPLDWASAMAAQVGAAFAISRWAVLSKVRGLLGARRRPKRLPDRIRASRTFVLLTSLSVVGLIFLWTAPGWNAMQKWLWQYRWTLGFVLVFGLPFAATWLADADLATTTAILLISTASVSAWLFGWLVLAPGGLRLAEAVTGAPLARDDFEEAVRGRVAASAAGEEGRAATPMAMPARSPVLAASATTTAAPAASDTAPFTAVPPARLPNFDAVGGMEPVKRRLTETLGLLLAFPDEARAFKVAFNGILLHGPPGTGKTFLAKATAGEFACNFISVGSAELVSSFRGQSARRINDAFDFARANSPAILFFDEFDAIARRRDQNALSGEDRQSLDQLLRALESVRDRLDVQVIAATNGLNELDPAVIRPGRFDVRVRVDLPDLAAREAILGAQLRGRPCDPDLDLAAVASRTEGLSAAALAGAVNHCAMKVLGEVSAGNSGRVITQADLEAAIREGGGQDRPLAESWTWNDLVLSDTTKRELQELQRLIEDPERAARFGIAPPSGALLYGPPGTGKTSIARVLAAQARTSFYPIKGSDIVSKWLGQSEQNISQLFTRARENRPSIVFLDEIDAIAPRRSAGFGGSAIDRMVNQLLQEIDGLGSGTGVFVLGATNRPDILDDALLRGGRLGRRIEIPLPDEIGRRELLLRFTRRMPLAADVSIDAVANRTTGYSGADLEALCQEAAVRALMRTSDGDRPVIGAADFDVAIREQAKDPR